MRTYQTSVQRLKWRYLVIGDIRVPKTKIDLIKSLQSIPKIDFDVIEIGNVSDRRIVMNSLDRRLRNGSVSVILIQEK